MKKAIVVAFILVLISATLIAQDDPASEYSITFLMDKKDQNQVWGTLALFPDRSFSEIWTAIIKMLIVEHNTVLVADKTSGFISSKDNFGDYQYFIEGRSGGVEVMFPTAGGVKGIQKISDKICKQILDQLPPKSK